MTEAVAVEPDERAMDAHLRHARFRAGIDAGCWRVISYDWPRSMIAISAAPREDAPEEFVFSFELSGYPQAGPTACMWDLEADNVLAAAKRPKGFRAERVFRADWEDGKALYAPWDRVALAGHPDWPARYPREAWNSKRDLAFYLEEVHDILNAEDYEGI